MHFFCPKCLRWSVWFKWRESAPNCEHCDGAGLRNPEPLSLVPIVAAAIAKAKE